MGEAGRLSSKIDPTHSNIPLKSNSWPEEKTKKGILRINNVQKRSKT
jgi:hypothetical protein